MNFLPLFLLGVELKLLNFKKDHTSMLESYLKPGDQTAIYKVVDGKRSGYNLRHASYCRLCGSVEPDFAGAFTHSAEFRCATLLPEYAVSCPMCDNKFTTYWDFSKHVKTRHEIDFRNHFDFANMPENMQPRGYRQAVTNKSETILWMLQCCIKLYENRSADSNLFLPHMSSAFLAEQRSFKNSMLCPYTVCVCLSTSSKSAHQHKWETLASGRCYQCSNYHQFVRTTAIQRACNVHQFRGVLPW